MRVLYKVDGDLMLSIFDDVSFFHKENNLLFTSAHCDSLLVKTDKYTATLILSKLYEWGKIDLSEFESKISISLEIE